jgi:hypothetical protein
MLMLYFIIINIIKNNKKNKKNKNKQLYIYKYIKCLVMIRKKKMNGCSL